MHIDGRCHCGAITYEAKVNPDNVVICHCTDCQTFSSAPYRVSVLARLANLRVTGEPKPYRKVGGSGRGVRVNFCGECGTALYSVGEGRDVVALRLGAIKQRAELPPKRQGFCASAMPWAMDIRDVPQIAPQPPAGA
jgi:hypothetical protein